MQRVVFLGLLVALPGLGNSVRANPETPVAVVNKDTITVEELKTQLQGQTPGAEPKLAVSEALNRLIIDKLVSQKAAAIDLSQDPDFQKSKTDTVMKTVFNKLYKAYVADLVSVLPEEVEQYYHDSLETKFKIPEQVKVSHILIEPEEDANLTDPTKRKQAAEKTALVKANEIKKRAKKEDFEELAKKFSKDVQTAMRGGDMGYQKRGQLLPEIDSAVFAAKLGEVLGPFRSPHGYHIMKVFDHIQEGYQELDDKLRQNILNRLKGERITQRNKIFLDSLRRMTEYEFNDSVIALPDTVKVDDKIWCLVLGRSDTLRAGQIREELLNYTLFSGVKQLSLEDKQDFLKKKSIWVQLKILEQTARKLGYLDLPEVKELERNFTSWKAEQSILQEAAPPYNPSPEEIQEYFDSHPEQFKAEFPLHVYHIIFDDSATALAVRDSILNGADFVEMAKRYYPGQAEIQEVAYDLGYISKYEMPEGFYQAADQLEPGQVSLPFKTFLGYHLIKLIDRKKDQTLQEVSPQIIKTLQEEHQKKSRAEWEAKLKKRAKIKIFQDALDRIDLSQSESKTDQPESKPN